jgi:hypothetical protein
MPTPWRLKRDKRGWSGFRIVSMEQACAETGLTRERLLGQPEVEQLTRVGADGRRELAVRVPARLLKPPEGK